VPLPSGDSTSCSLAKALRAAALLRGLEWQHCYGEVALGQRSLDRKVLNRRVLPGEAQRKAQCQAAPPPAGRARTYKARDQLRDQRACVWEGNGQQSPSGSRRGAEAGSGWSRGGNLVTGHWLAQVVR
jgi:hypothetical protein